jgi:hypothetical protein
MKATYEERNICSVQIRNDNCKPLNISPLIVTRKRATLVDLTVTQKRATLVDVTNMFNYRLFKFQRHLSYSRYNT